MARSLQAVWLLRGCFRATAPISVGGLYGGADLPVARNGRGRLFVPGTSLGGAIRAAFLRSLGDQADSEEQVRALFGWTPDQGDGGHASYLTVHDALLKDAALERRDGVGIDRFTGAAADNFLYSREVVAAGATLDLAIEVEEPRGADGKPAPQIAPLVPRLAGMLQSEGITVGAASSKGLGRLEAVDVVELDRLDLSDRAHLRAWWGWRSRGELKVRPPRAAVAPAKHKLDQDRWTFRIHWEPVDPVMVKSGGEGSEVAQIPLCTRHMDGGWRAVLPGSALRGALRAHAERIVRTTRSGFELRPSLLEQVKVPLAVELFGRARAAGDEVARGAVSVEDCLHADRLEEALSGEEGEPTPGQWHRRARVAVDRWTGGALDSALFQVREPRWEQQERGRSWGPLVLHLDLSRHRPTQEAMMALLWLVLRDLAQGWLPLGFGSRQGMGAVKVTGIQAQHGGKDLPPLDAAMWPLPKEWRDLVTKWEAAWTSANL